VTGDRLPPGDPGPIGSANIGSACAMFDPAGRVLLVKHTYGRLNWELPGGVCLPGEPPATGAERELGEETGLRLTAKTLSGVYYERDHGLGPMVHFVFRFAPPATAAPVPADAEISDVGWFELGDLPRPMSDFTETRIRDALDAGTSYRVITGRLWLE